MNDLLVISGILFWIMLITFIVSQFLLNTGLHYKFFGNLFVGRSLVNSTQKLIKEINQQELTADTSGEFIASIIQRFTRIGIVTLLFTSIPLILLMQQNRLIGTQNELFEFQNQKVQQQAFHDSIQSELLTTQNELFTVQNRLVIDQNDKIDKQTVLLGSQNGLFRNQNSLVAEQNDNVESQVQLARAQNELLSKQTEKLDTQNHRLNLQNNIIEADRRSSLVELLSNILDKVDEEISDQKTEKRPSEEYLASLSDEEKLLAIENQDSLILEMLRLDLNKYHLSDALKGRIIALSRALRPYKVLINDELSDYALSPERGQLLINILESNLDTATTTEIYSKGDFSYAELGTYPIQGKRFVYLNAQHVQFSNSSITQPMFWQGNSFENSRLQYSSFERSILIQCHFKNAILYLSNFSDSSIAVGKYKDCDLNLTDFSDTRLIGCDFTGSSIALADFSNTEFVECEGLEFEQLITTKSLKGATGLPQKLMTKLKKENPCLFSEEGCKKIPMKYRISTNGIKPDLADTYERNQQEEVNDIMSEMINNSY